MYNVFIALTAALCAGFAINLIVYAIIASKR